MDIGDLDIVGIVESWNKNDTKLNLEKQMILLNVSLKRVQHKPFGFSTSIGMNTIIPKRPITPYQGGNKWGHRAIEKLLIEIRDKLIKLG